MDLLQAVPDDLDQVAEAGDREVGQVAAFEHRLDPFSRLAAVRGSLDRGLLARRLSAGRACCGWWSWPGSYEHATLPGASTSWPSRRTGWWPASSSASGKAALAERAHLGEEYERYQRARPARLSAAELAAIRALADDIPALWAAPTTTVTDRKRLLRAVIESVQVIADGATERVQATVTWAGGHQTYAALSRPVARIDQLSYYPALTQRIRAPAGQGLDTTAIVGQLAAEGLRTPRLHDRFHPGEIQQLIRRLGLRPGLDHDQRTGQGSLGPGQWWLATLAREIGMLAATLFGWLRRGWAAGQLAVGGEEQIPVLGPGECLGLALAAAVQAQPVDQPAPVAGPVAGQPGHRDVPAAAAADPDDRGDPAPSPGLRPRRPHRLAALVFEDDPAAEAAAVLLSAARTPSSTLRPRRRRARSPAARRSGRSSRPVAAGTRSPRWCTAPGTCRRPGRGPGQRPPLVLPPGGQRPGLQRHIQRRQLPPSSRHCAASPREASADAPPARQACRHRRTDRS